MRLLLLSDHLSIHTKKWARSLAMEGIDILIFSLSSGNHEDYNDLKNIEVVSQDIESETFEDSNPFNKLRYLKKYSQLKRQIRKFNPDIVHAHYASSYGLLGALSGFHPFIISVWGWDVYHFPSNFITRAVLKYNFRRADTILSTSHVMARETKKYTPKNIEVTPFGIDTERFKPIEVESIFDKGSFVIGTVKTLEKKYGIEFLIRAFSKLVIEFDDQSLKLLIVGDGSQKDELESLANELQINNHVSLVGKIAHHKVPEYINMLDIYVALSTLDSESFGVAIIEASACGKPVVVSRVGGLPEVVIEGKTGLVVSSKNTEEAYLALRKLYLDKELRSSMGNAGRARVENEYNWKSCVNQMNEIYNRLLVK